jgi:hypothetical protein
MIFPVWTLKSVKSTFGMKYDQRVIIKFLWNEGTDVCDIAKRQTSGTVWWTCLSISNDLILDYRGTIRRQDLHDEICTGRLPLDDLNAKILAILDKSPFESTHSIAERLLVAYSIISRHLHDSVSFKSFHLNWVPHLLTDDLREKRKDHARTMLPFLHIGKRDGWHYHVTDNESWFLFNTSPSRMWTLSRDDVVTKSRLDIQSKKFIFTII